MRTKCGVEEGDSGKRFRHKWCSGARDASDKSTLMRATRLKMDRPTRTTTSVVESDSW
jgi:hypothetical protein